jgi:hypothetical protein
MAAEKTTDPSATEGTLPDYSCRTRARPAFQVPCFMLEIKEKVNIQSTFYIIKEA